MDDDAPEWCRYNCTEVLNSSRIVSSHSAVKLCAGSDKVLPKLDSTWSDYPFLSADDAPTYTSRLYMCFGVNFSNQMNTLKVIVMLRAITRSIEKYMPAQGNIEVIGSDGQGGWDTFGITHTMKTNQCTISYLNSIAEWVQKIRKYEKDVKAFGSSKVKPKIANKYLVQNLMSLNMTLFRDTHGAGPYLQMMNLPGNNLIPKIADVKMGTRYKQITKWKPDQMLHFDVEKFRNSDDFRDHWNESSWILTPIDMHFGDQPMGWESFSPDGNIINHDVWETVTKNIHYAHLKDFILGVRVTKNDPAVCLIMYAGVIKRPMSNYGYSAVYLCVTQYLGYYLSGDLISFCDMLDECIGLTDDEKKLITDEIKNVRIRNYNGTLEDYCKAWRKGMLDTIPPDPYTK